MTEQISNAVEAIKLAYLSHTPVVWLVTGDKEVASKVVEEFIIEHFGTFRSRQYGISSVNFEPFSNSSALEFLKDLENDLDKPLRYFIGEKHLKDFKINSHEKALTPSIFYTWHAKDAKEANSANSQNSQNSISTLMQSVEQFVSVHLGMEVDDAVKRMEAETLNTIRQSMAIVASPTLPPKSWLTKYIDVIYIKPLLDNEIREIILDVLSSKGIIIDDNNRLEQLVTNLRGFSAYQISQTLTRCIASGFFDYKTVMWAKILKEIRYIKRQLLDGFVGLKWVDIDDDDKHHENDAETAKTKHHDSLAVISEWLEARKSIFEDTKIAQKCGYDIPKGLLITGIPGTGKSMMAKESAKILGIPLISLDMGDLQEGIVGASEQHMVDALRMVEAMAPCVLWIDEIEKAFSGSSNGNSDGGVMRRMFGKFLTWMQEKTAACFVFATSNDISKLPPELFRSERFDDKYFSFMPMVDECAAIFSSLIKRENKKYKKNNPDNDQARLFPKDLTEPNVWREFLNRYSAKSGYVLMDGNKWSAGCIPQRKLFTGADISMVVKFVKFKLLKEYSAKGHFPTSVVLQTTEKVLDDFKPYGQTNLKDIVRCFIRLSINRFRCASASSVIDFDDFNIETAEMEYHSDRYSDDYDQVLYATIVGAINFYAKEIIKDENIK